MDREESRLRSTLSRLSRPLMACAALALVLCGAAQAQAQNQTQAGMAAMKSRYEELQGELSNNAYQRPLYLNSREQDSTVKGDIYAVLAYPFAQVREALDGPEHWCDILILHLNTKYCRLLREGGKTTLRMQVGKKTEQDLNDTYRVDLRYHGGSSAAEYFSSSMLADKGPLDTSNYRIEIEAIPLDERRSFLHFSYAYSYGMASRLALRAYLMTVGRDKVGFSVVKRDANGQAQYVSGSRATVERNTMRYYLAIDAYLAALEAPASERLEKRLAAWYGATEQYPRQLHELTREEYLSMKRKEVARQQRPGS